MKYIKLFKKHNPDYINFINSENNKTPNICLCLDNKDIHINHHKLNDDYLTFTALESGTISFNIGESIGTDMITSISYSTDNGETWTTVQNQNNKEEILTINVDVNVGDEILWKGIATQLSKQNNDYVSCFKSTCEFDAKGNIMSLLYGDNFKNQYTIEDDDGVFYELFANDVIQGACKLVNAKDLVLPATTLAEGCYGSMFFSCTSLTTAPELPATILADWCYSQMFSGCTSLTTPPELPATTLAYECYSYMFQGCTSLTSTPELPATTLAYECYAYMFKNCTSLTTSPELPATTLTEYCYSEMFYGCTSLTKAPELPATTLASCCYDHMFYSCTSLNYIKAMFTTTPSNSYTQNWVQNVASSGTFVKNSAAQWSVTGVNGVPSGWIVQTANE